MANIGLRLKRPDVNGVVTDINRICSHFKWIGLRSLVDKNADSALYFSPLLIRGSAGAHAKKAKYCFLKNMFFFLRWLRFSLTFA